MRSGVVASVLCVSLVTGGAVAVGSPLSAAPTAAPHASSVPTGSVPNQLTAVWCTQATDCFAVGQAGVTTLIEHWNGLAWSLSASPKITGTLAGVSCSAVNSCFAVGSQRVATSNQALIERWNGKAWSIVASPHPAGSTGSELRAVACTSPTFCIAAGSQFVPGATASKTLIERWNGKTWSITPSPNPANARSFRLYGVSCTAPSNCFAVGSDNLTSGGGLRTLVERWNGTKWAAVPSPTPNAGLGSELLGVSCSLATSCFAVGDTQYGNANEPVSLAERWDGKSWSVSALPPKSRAFNRLSGVSCTSAKFCFAVGYLQYNGDPLYVAPITLVYRWNGKGWSNATSPNPGATETGLAGISCNSDTKCTAVGRSTNSNFVRSPNKLRTLAERWNGTTWSVVATPNGGSAPFAVLTDVSCTSATNCVAVGNVLNATGNVTLIEQWNGTAWLIVPSPNPPGAKISQLAGVSCTSETSCIAVGRYSTATDGRSFKTLIERWNGTTWSIVTSPDPVGNAFARLDRVSCASATSCMAIGVSSVTRSTTDRAFSERWNGSTWTIVGSPAFPARGPAAVGLSGVSCPTTTMCMAVYGFSYGTGRPLNFMMVEQWNGTKWTNIGSSGSEMNVDFAFSGVSCTSPTNCVITGTITQLLGISFAFPKTLIEQWDGTKWLIVSSPNPSPGTFPRLDAVSCVSATSCITVGAYSTVKYFFDPAATLTERWDGTNWSLVASPNPAGASSADLVSVSCATATSCMAVGSYQVTSTAATKPLTERWDGTGWTIVPAA